MRVLLSKVRTYDELKYYRTSLVDISRRGRGGTLVGLSDRVIQDTQHRIQATRGVSHTKKD